MRQNSRCAWSNGRRVLEKQPAVWPFCALTVLFQKEKFHNFKGKPSVKSLFTQNKNTRVDFHFTLTQTKRTFPSRERAKTHLPGLVAAALTDTLHRFESPVTCN